MNGLMRYFSLLGIGLIVGCSGEIDQTIKTVFPESIKLTAENKNERIRTDEAITIDIKALKEKVSTFNPNACVILAKDNEFASQVDDLDEDGQKDQIVFISDFNPNEKKNIEIRFARIGQKTRKYKKRTQAELSHKFGGKFITNNEGRPEYEGGEFKNVTFLRVPPQHTDHTFFIRYEGPGWESDKVGYRFYLDWRNATDIFGKKTPEMVLQDVGQDGFDSYHEMSDWGMDVLKVGESLGIGSIGMWSGNKAEHVSKTDSITCEIVLNGLVQSLIRTKYFGWKVGTKVFQLTSDLSIYAGSRLTKHELTISGNPENLCTGIVKLPETQIIQPQRETGNWTYFATYGKQSLAEDQLGMAVLFRSGDLIRLTEDEQSHVIVLKPKNNKLTYYFLAAWQQEQDGIENEKKFIEYLDQTVQRLDSPIKITY